MAVNAADTGLTTPVTDILNTWTLNKGYPVITPMRMAGGVHLHQRRFLEELTEDVANLLWWVPVNLATKTDPNFGNTSPDFWFNEKDKHYTPTEAIADDDWFLVNKKQTYYYRVAYESENWQKLGDELTDGDYTKIHEQSRAQLLDDALDLAKYNHIDHKDALHIVKYLKKESAYVPWRAADPALSEFYRMMHNNVKDDYTQDFIREISEEIYKKYGAVSTASDDYHAKLARVLAMKWACRSGNEQCLTDAHELVVKVITEGAVLEPETRTMLYCNGMRGATQETVTAALDFIGEADPTMRTQFATALGCMHDDTMLKATAAVILANAGVTLSTGEKQAFVNSMYTNSRVGLNAIFELIKELPETVATLYGTETGNRVYDLANFVTNEEQEQIILDLMENNPTLFSASVTANIKTRMGQNLAWVAENVEEINEFLVNYYEGGALAAAASATMVLVAFLTTYLMY